MIFLRLLGNTVGAVFVYWGVMLFLIVFYFAACGLSQWLVKRTTPVERLLERGRLLGVPGVLVLFWFAGAAAHISHSLPPESSGFLRIAVDATAILCVGSLGWTFDWIHRRYLELYKSLWPTGFVVATALVVHVVLLGSPERAARIGASWAKMLEGSIRAMVEG